MEGGDEVGEKAYTNDIPAVEKGSLPAIMAWLTR